MGIKANTLRYRSKRDGEIIVGSEIRAALDELENENSELRAQLEHYKEVFRCAGDVIQWDFDYLIKYDGADSRSFLANLLSLEDAVRAAKEARE